MPRTFLASRPAGKIAVVKSKKSKRAIHWTGPCYVCPDISRFPCFLPFPPDAFGREENVEKIAQENEDCEDYESEAGQRFVEKAFPELPIHAFQAVPQIICHEARHEDVGISASIQKSALKKALFLYET